MWSPAGLIAVLLVEGYAYLVAVDGQIVLAIDKVVGFNCVVMVNLDPVFFFVIWDGVADIFDAFLELAHDNSYFDELSLVVRINVH